MQRLTDDAMTALGGTTAVARLIHAPVSTVHSWKRSGISPSRLAHLKLAAKEAGIFIDWATAVESLGGADFAEDLSDHAADSAVEGSTASAGSSDEVSSRSAAA